MSRPIDLLRVQDDFDYYTRKLLVVKTKTDGLSRLKLNFPQKLVYYGITPEIQLRERWKDFVILDHGWRYYDERKLPLRQYILKARQEGMSTASMARLFHRSHTSAGTNSMAVAQDDDATSTIFQIAKLFYSFLPEVIKPKTKNSNARELLFQEPDESGGLNSWIRIQTAGGSAIGRSKTIHHLACSEISFWPNPEEIVDGLFQAVPSSGNTSIILETTAKGMGSWAYNVWIAAKEARAKGRHQTFQPVFLPWFINPEYRSEYPDSFEFTKEDLEFKNEYDLDWEQVYWYNYLKCSEFELAHPGQGIMYLRTEFPSNDMEPWASGLNAAFASETVEQIYKTQVRGPQYRYDVSGRNLIASKGGLLKVWEKPIPGVQYAIGVDTSHGVGLDDSVICVLAHPGYRQVAEWSSDRVGPKQLAGIIETIARWYNEAVVAVEVNGGSGLLCNASLYETYSNLYLWEYIDKNSQSETKKIGWETTQRTKTLLVDHANSLMSPQMKVVVRSEHVAFQMRQMIIQQLGGGAANYQFLNHTGDQLMAWLITCMCMWRKIARFDASDGDLVPVALDNNWRSPHEYDQMASDIVDGVLQPEVYRENWLNS